MLQVVNLPQVARTSSIPILEVFPQTKIHITPYATPKHNIMIRTYYD
jgi:hypothetical protein